MDTINVEENQENQRCSKKQAIYYPNGFNILPYYFNNHNGYAAPLPPNQNQHELNLKAPPFRTLGKLNFPANTNNNINYQNQMIVPVPDDLVRDFRLIELTVRPNCTRKDEYFELSEEIWAKFIENQQTMDTFRKKMELWKDLHEALKANTQFSKYGLQVVGSSMSGFGSNSSDVDMCLLVRREEVDQRYEAVDILHGLLSLVRKIPFAVGAEVIYAKVPLLKFRDKKRNLDVDLNCNNYVGIRNTQLLYVYSQMDWRVRPMVLIVKLWAQIHGINDAKTMTISSYSLVLMVIHFLQTLHEPILPCLHRLCPDKYSPDSDVFKIKINDTIPTWKSKNQASLGELLLKFLEYFSLKFDFSRHTVSIKLGSFISTKFCMQGKSYKNDAHQWKYICIEEPFDGTNTARSVYDREAFDRIRSVFFISYQRLFGTRRLTSIFHLISPEELRMVMIHHFHPIPIRQIGFPRDFPLIN